MATVARAVGQFRMSHILMPEFLEDSREAIVKIWVRECGYVIVATD
jgi:hypothetical protein